MHASKLLGIAGYMIIFAVVVAATVCMTFFLGVISSLFADGADGTPVQLIGVFAVLATALFVAIPGLQLIAVAEFARSMESQNDSLNRLAFQLNVVLDNQDRAISVLRKS